MTKLSTLSRQYWPTIVLFALLLASWQLTVSLGGIREYLLPSPLSVWNALWHGDTAWLPHLWTTTLEIIGAFFLAAVVGVAALRLQVAGLLVALDSVAELPLTVTVEPTNCSAEVASLVCCIEMSVCRLVFMLICCSTPANATSCWVN